MQSGEQFLHERNTQFHASQEVNDTVAFVRAQGEKFIDKPEARIGAYLTFLADPVNDGVLTGDKQSIGRQVESHSISLTKHNAEAYARFQSKIARERGLGGQQFLDETESGKLQALRVVRQDQQKQLTGWAEELNSDETDYPNWFKYWVFDNVTDLTAFNEDLNSKGQPKGFEKRSSGSFALFPELDRQSLSLVYDAVKEKTTGKRMGFEYDDIRELLAKSKFSELYAAAQNRGFKITDKLRHVTTGSWKRFAQSDHKHDAEALSGLVSSYRTGWCTAGQETAAEQLSQGDFYVWCSTNPETGKDEVPRIAIRTDEGHVEEVRGTIDGSKQELEPELYNTALEQLKDMPGGDEYFQKVEDMRRLTTLDKQFQADIDFELTDDDLRFLYGIDRTIKGFGYGQDPRVYEILADRNDFEDLVRAFGSKRAYIDYIRDNINDKYPNTSSLLLKCMRGLNRAPFDDYLAQAMGSIAESPISVLGDYMDLKELQILEPAERLEFLHLVRKYSASAVRTLFSANKAYILGIDDVQIPELIDDVEWTASFIGQFQPEARLHAAEYIVDNSEVLNKLLDLKSDEALRQFSQYEDDFMDYLSPEQVTEFKEYFFKQFAKAKSLQS